MKKLIAAVAFLAAQPANAQTILGSIPEEFRGDWCWQENAFRLVSGASDVGLGVRNC